MVSRIIARISGLIVIMAVATSLFLAPLSVAASPGNRGHSVRAAAQNVDYLSADQAASLALGFTVLVPSWVPAPFGGSPSISGGGGNYSLYWMIPGGDPTFLEVTGEVGGGLPAGSPADLNVQLSINASVQGYDAIHDVTSIYDTVWWLAGGVLYTVSSRNMTGTDSLSLANSLIALQAPVASEPEPTLPPVEETATETATAVEEVPVEETEVATEEPDTSDQGNTVPDAQADTSSSASVGSQSAGGQSGASEPVGDNPVSNDGTGAPRSTSISSATEPPSAAGAGLDAGQPGQSPSAVQTPSSGATDSGMLSDGTAGATGSGERSDGTAGPTLPVRGDGTGGSLQFTLP